MILHIWKTVPEYRTALLRGSDNMDRDSPIMTFVFSRKILLKMREYVEKHGVGDSREPGRCRDFMISLWLQTGNHMESVIAVNEKIPGAAAPGNMNLRKFRRM